MKSLDTAISAPRVSIRRWAFASLFLLRRPSSVFSGLSSVVSRLASGFTLLEVMLVIGIIAILASLLFPVLIGARAKTMEKQAMAETRTILMAIKAYRQEYGKWPAQTQAAEDMTYITNNYLVIQPLLGSNVTHPQDSTRQFNPKEKIFLNLQISSNRMDVWDNYLDPWGIPYVICMDENGDNSLLITNQVTYSATNAGQEICINLWLANYSVANTDAGVASLGGTADTLPWNTWTEP